MLPPNAELIELVRYPILKHVKVITFSVAVPFWTLKTRFRFGCISVTRCYAVEFLLRENYIGMVDIFNAVLCSAKSISICLCIFKDFNLGSVKEI